LTNTGIVDIVLSNIGNSISFLKVGPQFARVLRVLRVSRLFKLMKAKQLQGINKIFKTLIFSLPSLMNVLVLLFLIYFIFAVLAVFLFKDYKVADKDIYQNEIFNFNTFHNALLTLFVLSTGEDWPSFMYEYGANSGIDTLISQTFFIIFVFLSNIVMINVFQLVVMQQFEEYYFNTDNAVNSFDEMVDNFKTTWNLFTVKSRGTKIKASRVAEFFYFLEYFLVNPREPLGYRIKEDTEDDDIEEILINKDRRKKVKTVHKRNEISYHINLWRLQM
jgi:Ion transport protein